MPGMKIPFKTHLLHLLNFFRVTDHIFEVTEKEKKKWGKQKRKGKTTCSSEQNYRDRFLSISKRIEESLPLEVFESQKAT